MNDDIYKEIDELIHKKDEKIIEYVPVEEVKTLDTIQEQIESPMTTSYCSESVDDKSLKDIEKHPENYIEINFIKNIRIVDSFYIRSNLKAFHYNNKEYNIDEEMIYILPTKKGYFMPTCFYRENFACPVDFRQRNKGITGKALSLLYDVKLYIDMITSEEGKYNLFIVILLIVSLTAYIIGLYFNITGV